jgi:hypothetical protein
MIFATAFQLWTSTWRSTTEFRLDINSKSYYASRESRTMPRPQSKRQIRERARRRGVHCIAVLRGGGPADLHELYACNSRPWALWSTRKLAITSWPTNPFIRFAKGRVSRCTSPAVHRQQQRNRRSSVASSALLIDRVESALCTLPAGQNPKVPRKKRGATPPAPRQARASRHCHFR